MYCDCKIYAFNDILFNLGSKYARCMGAWFSAGVHFSLIALAGISMRNGSFIDWLQNLLTAGLSISIVDFTIVIISTIISIVFHEIGHAVAAASEGAQIEYVAIFVAVLFPGALVALNYDQLQNLSLFSKLRIYCAGIWHNVILCAVCLLLTVLLPVVLYPFYVSGDGLMVMGNPEPSPLSEYLSAHDVILSVDGLRIATTDEWIKMLAQGNTEKISGSGKGYCVPNSWMDASKNLWQISDSLSCPDELVAFEKLICNGSVIFDEIGKNSDQKEAEGKYCLIAKDVVKLHKCGNGWWRTEHDGSNCTCSQDEYCLEPVLNPGFSWIEVSYARPYSLGCLQKDRNISSHATDNNLGQNPCEGSFVYVGDLSSSARSVKLSPYRPRWALFLPIAYVPYIMGNGLSCLLHVSAALAVVNCLPCIFWTVKRFWRLAYVT
ncbi:hypothetical protein ACP70R_037092 [Stipagrostis hirtigluma subsp. patula]